jgi:hypothetical protein
MLWLGLLTRDTGIAASKRLGITDEVAALNFDLAVSYRLFRLRAEERKDLARRIAHECGIAFFGGEDQEDDDGVLDAADLRANDQFADENTEVW